MNRYLGILICILLISCNREKNKEHQELVIIGTVHFPTQKINADSILYKLEKVAPSCILMEADSSVFNLDFSFKKTYDENEYNAVLEYKEKYPNTNIRPIEFEGRNEYRKVNGLYSGASSTFKILNEINRANKLTQEEQIIWENFGRYWGKRKKSKTKI